ncbi:hypothetical protein DIPPA_24079 [Diplonema papillatum]|nr:hypothetical protein DIPPA_24079 [Diplonema papillatum]
MQHTQCLSLRITAARGLSGVASEAGSVFGRVEFGGERAVKTKNVPCGTLADAAGSCPGWSQWLHSTGVAWGGSINAKVQICLTEAKYPSPPTSVSSHTGRGSPPRSSSLLCTTTGSLRFDPDASLTSNSSSHRPRSRCIAQSTMHFPANCALTGSKWVPVTPTRASTLDLAMPEQIYVHVEWKVTKEADPGETVKSVDSLEMTVGSTSLVRRSVQRGSCVTVNPAPAAKKAAPAKPQAARPAKPSQGSSAAAAAAPSKESPVPSRAPASAPSVSGGVFSAVFSVLAALPSGLGAVLDAAALPAAPTAAKPSAVDHFFAANAFVGLASGSAAFSLIADPSLFLVGVVLAIGTLSFVASLPAGKSLATPPTSPAAQPTTPKAAPHILVTSPRTSLAIAHGDASR